MENFEWITDCQLDVQSWNYTIVTSKCKGPKYPAKPCCEAFKDLACPNAKDLNDLSNNCATTMFSYINLYGKYPPGLFANICRDSRRGLECTAAQKSNQVNRATSTTSAAATTIPTTIPLMFAFLTVLCSMFLWFLISLSLWLRFVYHPTKLYNLEKFLYNNV